MAERRQSFVYILTNRHATVLYVGVTSALEQRIWQHRHKTFPGFSARYNLSRLVWYEVFRGIENAIHREKQIKGWARAKKLKLVETENPNWVDLAADWFG